MCTISTMVIGYGFYLSQHYWLDKFVIHISKDHWLKLLRISTMYVTPDSRGKMIFFLHKDVMLFTSIQMLISYEMDWDLVEFKNCILLYDTFIIGQVEDWSKQD